MQDACIAVCGEWGDVTHSGPQGITVSTAATKTPWENAGTEPNQA